MFSADDRRRDPIGYLSVPRSSGNRGWKIAAGLRPRKEEAAEKMRK